ncbi:hypothetical protein HJ588_02540 [Flexivirga sp. ID2601S]|uniref:Uncharacterized protein n=1 Tax=Flexivirga aerilata TaxID=1656889 RepID=A0A849AFX0_9MICO|nr:hypothetical protein [Flexivirga aerilata]NNG38151.1 hypothetical protein [Flexivirga aerilata]
MKIDPVGACTTALNKSNSAATTWNKAVETQVSSQLDSAAANFRKTATELRKLGPQAGDSGFVAKVGTVASDMESMAKSRTDRQTVSTTKFNADNAALRTYCQALITK